METLVYTLVFLVAFASSQFQDVKFTNTEVNLFECKRQNWHNGFQGIVEIPDYTTKLSDICEFEIGLNSPQFTGRTTVRLDFYVTDHYDENRAHIAISDDVVIDATGEVTFVDQTVLEKDIPTGTLNAQPCGPSFLKMEIDGTVAAIVPVIIPCNQQGEQFELTVTLESAVWSQSPVMLSEGDQLGDYVTSVIVREVNGMPIRKTVKDAPRMITIFVKPLYDHTPTDYLSTDSVIIFQDHLYEDATSNTWDRTSFFSGLAIQFDKRRVCGPSRLVFLLETYSTNDYPSYNPFWEMEVDIMCSTAEAHVAYSGVLNYAGPDALVEFTDGLSPARFFKYMHEFGTWTSITDYEDEAAIWGYQKARKIQKMLETTDKDGLFGILSQLQRHEDVSDSSWMGSDEENALNTLAIEFQSTSSASVAFDNKMQTIPNLLYSPIKDACYSHALSTMDSAEISMEMQNKVQEIRHQVKTMNMAMMQHNEADLKNSIEYGLLYPLAYTWVLANFDPYSTLPANNIKNLLLETLAIYNNPESYTCPTARNMNNFNRYLDVLEFDNSEDPDTEIVQENLLLPLYLWTGGAHVFAADQMRNFYESQQMNPGGCFGAPYGTMDTRPRTFWKEKDGFILRGVTNEAYGQIRWQRVAVIECSQCTESPFH
ncbi:hypothetical protein ScPMuIL_006331 [Solemya velum]